MMKKYLYKLLILILVLAGCEGFKEEVAPSESYVADKPIAIEYNGSSLYVMPVDQSESTPWGSSPSFAGAGSLTDGALNTRRIVDSLGEGDYAAYLCDTLSAYGYEDWYLPSKGELNALFQHKDEIGTLEPYFYWSSTETNDYYSWGQDFYDGARDSTRKYYYESVRCVRKD
jgi:hypothetical protein